MKSSPPPTIKWVITIEKFTESTLASTDSVEESAEIFTYRIDMNYLGASFSGWQSQPSGNTVQDKLESALEIILRKKVRIVGASRTDAGVNAEHQVASFRIDRPLDTSRVLRSLQGLVPPEIGLTAITETPPTFHPIASAHSKLYRYRIWLGPEANAFVRPFAWCLPRGLDLDAMEEAGRTFVGRHDFRSFAAMDGSSRTFDRMVLDVRCVRKGDNLVEFYILGEGFLKQMVRNIVGTLVEVGRGKRSPEDIRSIIAAQDRRAAGMTAPACGLSLVAIHYSPCLRIADGFLRPTLDFSFAIPSA